MTSVLWYWIWVFRDSTSIEFTLEYETCPSNNVSFYSHSPFHRVDEFLLSLTASQRSYERRNKRTNQNFCAEVNWIGVFAVVKPISIQEKNHILFNKGVLHCTTINVVSSFFSKVLAQQRSDFTSFSRYIQSLVVDWFFT